MRFMVIRKADRDTEAGAQASQELIDAMAKYMEEMAGAGVMLDGMGLQPTSKGARVKFNGGRPTVVDGPFAESKELIAGVSILDVASLDEAIEWCRKWPPVDGGGNVDLEIRQVYELDDLGSGEGIERLRELGLKSGR